MPTPLHPINSYHYNNCLYHGQIKNFQRQGNGILFHDNGLTGIIKSGNNRLKTHNLFLGQNVILSVIYHQHVLDFVYKNGKNLLIINMAKGTDTHNQKWIINTNGYLVQYDYKRVSKLVFKHNVLKQKILLTIQQTRQIIQQNKLQKLMSQSHIHSLQLHLPPTNPSIKILPKTQTQTHIGFIENNNLQGLGLVLYLKDFNIYSPYQFQFQVLERGFFQGGRLEYFGEIYYQNGNHYFGQIKQGKMHGHGLLVYKKQERFVQGTFYDGVPLKLNQNPNFNLYTQQGQKLYNQLKRKLHSTDPELWINGQVNDLPDPIYFQLKLKQAKQFLCEHQDFKNLQKIKNQLKLSRKVEEFKSSRIIKTRQNYQEILNPPPVNFMTKFKSPQIKMNKQQQNKAMQLNISNYSFKSGGKIDSSRISNNGLSSPSIKQNSIIDHYQLLNSSTNKQQNQNPFLQQNLPSLKKTSQKQSLQKSHSKSRSKSSQKTQQIIHSSPIRQLNSSRQKIQLSALQKQLEQKLQKQYYQLQKSHNKEIYPQYRQVRIGKITQSNPNPRLKYQSPYKKYQSPSRKYQSPKKLYQSSKKMYQSPERKYKSSRNDYQNTQNNQYVNRLKRMNMMCQLAANQSLKLANSNKQKQQKYLHYQHYTHKKHFNYTQQTPPNLTNHTAINSPYQPLHHTSTNQPIQSIQNKLKKPQLTNLMNRLYPHSHNLEQNNVFITGKYDSSYQQTLLGRNMVGEIKKQGRDNGSRKNTYGEDFKASVLKTHSRILK